MHDNMSIPNLSNMEFPIDNIINAGFRSHNTGWHFYRTGQTDTLYYIISGKVNFSADGNDLIAGENTVIYLPQGKKCHMCNMSESDKFTLYFVTFNKKQNLSLDFLEEISILYDKDLSIGKIFSDINKNHLAKGPVYKIKEFSLISELIYSIFIHHINTSVIRSPALKISKAVEYIQKNHYKNISIDHLCKLTGYSPSHFRRLFTKEYGMSAQDYLISFRIEKAKEMLLEDENRSIAEIADSLGICTCAYFCKLFKAHTNMSPQKFREKFLY